MVCLVMWMMARVHFFFFRTHHDNKGSVRNNEARSEDEAILAKEASPWSKKARFRGR